MSSRRKEFRIYGPHHFASTWAKFRDICDRDGQSASGLIRVWVEGYVARKDPGNPQRPLTAYAPGHTDQVARFGQEAFTALQGLAEERGGELRWSRIVDELRGELSGQALVDEAEKLGRRLTKAGVRVTK